MSGGHFDYKQYNIGSIADEIENVVKNNSVENEFGNANNYPDYVIAALKEGVRTLREAQIYAQRADWLFSGDDGPGTFVERLKEDLIEFGQKELNEKRRRSGK